MNTLLPDIYLGAAADIERRGWCQEMELGGNGEVCLRFAIEEQFDHEHPDWTEVCEEAFEFLADMLLGHKVLPLDRPGAIETWNDIEGRTASEVVAKLREAAVAVEAML